MAGINILDIGISVAFQPDVRPPAVELPYFSKPEYLELSSIVFVHGFQGHPYKTWSTVKRAKTVPTTRRPGHRPRQAQCGKRSLKALFLHGLRGRPKETQDGPALEDETASSREVPTIIISGHNAGRQGESVKEPSDVFWPRDLLPKTCPAARILMWGYDTKVTQYMTSPANKNNIFIHAKDLLFALRRERMMGRPLIFIAHSLGGIIVKDMLSISSVSTEVDLKDVVASTKAIIFMGTPHRGSQDMASIGDVARKVASIVMMDNSSAILDALGLKTSDLQRSQESFSRLWASYNFRVKTFQEGLGLTGVKLAMLNSKVVPEFSSLLGDHREYAETLQANHMDMCRFSSARDPNYRKVAGELRAICDTLETVKSRNTFPGEANLGGTQYLATRKASPFARKRTVELLVDPLDKDFLQSLHFPTMEFREQTIDLPARQTARWLFTNEIYKEWRNRRQVDKYSGLLWMKGKPGSGKSTLMKEALHQAWQEKGPNEAVAGFFFNAKGEELERNPTGLFRSLLYQLLPRYPDALRDMAYAYPDKNLQHSENKDNKLWLEKELKFSVEALFREPSINRTVLFIDALDECEEDSRREIAQFFRQLTTSAHDEGVRLDVCLSSRHYPNMALSNCHEIIVEEHNVPDIELYVRQKLAIGRNTDNAQWNLLRASIVEKSSGIFLWVVLVADLLLRHWDEGRNMKHLNDQLDQVPGHLEELFTQLLKSENPKELSATVRLFQWVILAAKPLRLQEWHHILAFARDSPSSLSEWRSSEHYTEDDEQLEKQIRNLSKGLIEVTTLSDPELADKSGFDTESIRAGAGSLVSNQGGTRLVQVIHDSVREFFLHNGFPSLDPSLGTHPIGRGHFAIFNACLAYFKISELDALVSARLRAHRAEQSRQRHPTSPNYPGHSPTDPVSINLLSRYWPEQASLSAYPLPDGQLRRSQSISSFGSAASSYDSPKAQSPIPASPAMSMAPSFDDLPQMASADDTETFRLDATRRFVEEQTWEDIPVYAASPVSSITARSQVLEDYPALLFYATVMLFTHAKLAEDGGLKPDEIARPLRNKENWTRWLALREDMPLDTTLLYHIVDKGFVSWIPLLIDRWRTDVNCHSEIRKTLSQAFQRRNQGVFHTLLRQDGLSLLAIDKKAEILEWMDLLIKRGMWKDYWKIAEDLHQIGTPSFPSLERPQDPYFRNTLHRAVVMMDIDLVLALLRQGFNVNAMGGSGMTPLHTACWLGEDYLDIIRVLLAHGAFISTRGHEGRTALHFACQSPKVSAMVVETLLEHWADANTITDGGETPLHFHPVLDAPKVVGLLLRASADIYSCDNSGLTPLDIARRPRFRKALDMMLAHQWKQERWREFSNQRWRPGPQHIQAGQNLSEFGNRRVKFVEFPTQEGLEASALRNMHG